MRSLLHRVLGERPSRRTRSEPACAAAVAGRTARATPIARPGPGDGACREVGELPSSIDIRARASRLRDQPSGARANSADRPRRPETMRRGRWAVALVRQDRRRGPGARRRRRLARQPAAVRKGSATKATATCRRSRSQSAYITLQREVTVTSVPTHVPRPRAREAACARRERGERILHREAPGISQDPLPTTPTSHLVSPTTGWSISATSCLQGPAGGPTSGSLDDVLYSIHRQRRRRAAGHHVPVRFKRPTKRTRSSTTPGRGSLTDPNGTERLSERLVSARGWERRAYEHDGKVRSHAPRVSAPARVSRPPELRRSAPRPWHLPSGDGFAG